MPAHHSEDKVERLSRLQRLQQRHREIGKILRDAISDDVDDGFDTSIHTTEQQQGRHPRDAPLSSSGRQNHTNEPVEGIVTGDEYNEQVALGDAPTSVASPRSASGSSRALSVGPLPTAGRSLRSAMHDDGAPPATVDMSPVAPKQKSNARTSISAVAAASTSSPLVVSHPDEQLLERQLGKTLAPPRSSTTPAVAASARQRYYIEEQGYPAPSSIEGSSKAHGPFDAADEATATTAASTPRGGVGDRARDDAAGSSSSPQRSTNTIPLTEALLRSLPLFQSLEEEVIRLQRKVEEKDVQIAALNKKTEALARNLVKALKERNQFEEELLQNPQAASAARAATTTNTTSASMTLSDTGMYSRAWGGSGPKVTTSDEAHDQQQQRHLVDELRLKEVELERCYGELDRMVATLGFTSIANTKNVGVEETNDTPRLLHELQRDVTMFTTSLRSVESQRDRLAAELRLSAACIENLDQRLLLSERELLQARLALAAKQNHHAHDSDATPSQQENGLDIVSVPLAARMHLARLSAEISALQRQLSQMQQDEQQRAAFDREVQEELKNHNESLEDQLTDVMSKLAGEMERHEATRRLVDHFEGTMRELYSNATLVARLIKTSKVDVDGVVDVALRRLDASPRHTAEGQPSMLDVIRPFALQVGRDLTAVSQLLMSVRESLAKHGISDADSHEGNFAKHADPTVAIPRSIKPPQHSQLTSPATAALAPPPKRRILIAPSVSSRQGSLDSAPGLRSTGLGWQRSGAQATTRSAERSPSPAYPKHDA
jgi:predicted  nucleic acid-binding Zn-ribbon protein